MVLEFQKIKRVLIANRGEIACRIIRSCEENGLQSIAVYSSEDTDSLHVKNATEAVLIPGVGAQAYINIESLVSVAIESKADVVVPGYGFLSESPRFAETLEKEGIMFAGPTGASVDTFGLKHSARKLAEDAQVPVVPGSDLINDANEAADIAEKIGYPIMLKSTAGGGGMGLKVCRDKLELATSFQEVISRGATLFNNSGCFLEKYVESGRHIEVQVFGNGLGYVRAFGERECSIQRRHQKVIEESPSPFIEAGNKELRKDLCICAAKLAASVKYKSAGTVEFLVDDETGKFYFLEMNTRLQVEHGITELVYDVDLVKLMLLQAEYELRGEVGLPQDILEQAGGCTVDAEGIPEPQGHAIECRVYAENPLKDFKPSPGVLHLVEFPKSTPVNETKLRIDHWISSGCKVSPYFDPLLAKVMVWGPSRQEALNAMIEMLRQTKLYGPTQNIDYLTQILVSKSFEVGRTLTTFLTTSFDYKPNLLEFVKPGSYTTIQDLPGREIAGNGVPLSGPSDPLFFQLANIIIGNHKYTEAFEICLKGPTIRTHTSTTICLSGGKFKFIINGKPAPMFTAISVPAGSTISIGKAQKHCVRAYLAIKGGLPDVAEYLGSKSCTPTLNLGGHQGRPILDGDCLSVVRSNVEYPSVELGFQLPKSSMPDLESITKDHVWSIRTIGGPHDSPEICSEAGLEMFYNTVYSVNLNSNRGCTRLDGPANVFSRADGGDGGTHPSNILEYPYPNCGISIVGNVVSLFGVDGATLSGFVCIAVPVSADWWKAGQVEVDGKVQFKKISYEEGIALKKQQDDFLDAIVESIAIGASTFPTFSDDLESPVIEEPCETILYSREAKDKGLPFFIRQAGERMLVLDFGSDHFTLANNGRQRAFQIQIEQGFKDPEMTKAVLRTECCSGSMSVVFEPSMVSRKELIKALAKMEESIPSTDTLTIESTLYKLPICFEHSAIDHCIERYMHSQRSQAPYLPDNTAYLMKANCINLREEFKSHVVGEKQVITAVSFLCANTLSVNLDPRTRFKTGKFNPARTFTPKGALGSGSVGYSIYSIDSPGGYLIWGMGLPDLCWNTFGRLEISEGKPWFFKNFDQIVYYEVDEEELTKLNQDLLLGKLEIEKEQTVLDFKEYTAFLEEILEEVEELSRKKAAVMQELLKEEEMSLARWIKDVEEAKNLDVTDDSNLLQDPSVTKITSSMAANIFKITCKPGDKVGIEDTIIILEAMKMEIAVKPVGAEDEDDDDGEDEVEENKPVYSKTTKFEVVGVPVKEGDVVSPGTILMFLRIL